MATKQEVEVQKKQEVATAQEATRSARYYVPYTDIHETDEALSIAMEVPGVAKDGVAVTLEKDILKVAGQVDFSNYEGLEAIYTELRGRSLPEELLALEQDRPGRDIRPGRERSAPPQSAQDPGGGAPADIGSVARRPRRRRTFRHCKGPVPGPS